MLGRLVRSVRVAAQAVAPQARKERLHGRAGGACKLCGVWRVAGGAGWVGVVGVAWGWMGERGSGADGGDAGPPLFGRGKRGDDTTSWMDGWADECCKLQATWCGQRRRPEPPPSPLALTLALTQASLLYPCWHQITDSLLPPLFIFFDVARPPISTFALRTNPKLTQPSTRPQVTEESWPPLLAWAAPPSLPLRRPRLCCSNHHAHTRTHTHTTIAAAKRNDIIPKTLF